MYHLNKEEMSQFAQNVNYPFGQGSAIQISQDGGMISSQPWIAAANAPPGLTSGAVNHPLLFRVANEHNPESIPMLVPISTLRSPYSHVDSFDMDVEHRVGSSLVMSATGNGGIPIAKNDIGSSGYYF